MYVVSLYSPTSFSTMCSTVSNAKPIQYQKQQPGITDLLEKAKGGPLTDSEIDCDLVNYSKVIDNIRSNTDQRDISRLANRLRIRLSVRIKTQTRLAVRGSICLAVRCLDHLAMLELKYNLLASILKTIPSTKLRWH